MGELGDRVTLLAESMGDHSNDLGKTHQALDELPNAIAKRSQQMQEIIDALTRTYGMVEKMLEDVGKDQDAVRSSGEGLANIERDSRSTAGEIRATIDTTDNYNAMEGATLADKAVASTEGSVASLEAADDRISDAATTLAGLMNTINELAVQATIAQEEIAEAGAHTIHALDDVRSATVAAGASYEKLFEYGENL